jgi:hypothetical protein
MPGGDAGAWSNCTAGLYLQQERSIGVEMPWEAARLNYAYSTCERDADGLCVTEENHFQSTTSQIVSTSMVLHVLHARQQHSDRVG